jgi:hypothetical protein
MAAASLQTKRTFHTAFSGVALSICDRGFIKIVAGDQSVRICPREGYGGPSSAAPNIGYADAGARFEPFVKIRNRRQPTRCEIMQECGPINARLPMAKVGSIHVVCDAASGAVSVNDFGQDLRDADDHVGERCDVGRIILLDENSGVFEGQPEHAIVRAAGVAVDGHKASHSLLFKPLAGVAFGDPGFARQLPGGHRPVPVERPVKAECASEIHAP